MTQLFLKPDAHRDLGQRMLACAFRGFFNILIWMKIVRIDDSELLEHCAREAPLIVAGNHPSLWDAPILIRRLVHVACIMKASLLKNPILSGGSKFAGFVPNHPRLLMVKAATEHLKSGGKMLIFPEGTRTRKENGEVNPFRPGLALISKKSGAPILPIFMITDSPFMCKGWPIWKPAPFPITISVRVGEVQEIGVGETTHAFSERLENYYRDELARLRG
ncbi:MAG: lysophospholipid acyltransferase family protein [Akkermansiaceae bacterium]